MGNPSRSERDFYPGARVRPAIVPENAREPDNSRRKAPGGGAARG